MSLSVNNISFDFLLFVVTGVEPCLVSGGR